MPPVPEKASGAEGGHTFRGQPPNPGEIGSNDDIEEYSYDVRSVGPDKVDDRHGPSKGMGGVLGTDK